MALLLDVPYLGLAGAILAIIIGIVILVWPKSLNLAVALYFLLIGGLQLLAYLL